jgi:hypothetical protein
MPDDITLGTTYTVDHGDTLKLVELHYLPEAGYVRIIFESHDGSNFTGRRAQFLIDPLLPDAYGIKLDGSEVTISGVSMTSSGVLALVDKSACADCLVSNFDPAS